MPPKPLNETTLTARKTVASTAQPSHSPQNQARNKRQKAAPQTSRPTHFLSLPIGHHPQLRTRIKDLHHKILPPGNPTTSAIEGIDQSILVDPRRLHFTLGVMSLSSANPAPSTNTGAGAQDGVDAPRTRTVTEAIALLRSLAPEIREIAASKPVALSLDKMGVLKTKKEQAGVLYVGPGDENAEETLKVNQIYNLLNKRFREEGFITETPRPLVLHCTLINASHRKPRGRGAPRAFSYREIFDLARPTASSSSVPAVKSSASASAPVWRARQREQQADHGNAIRVDFGTWMAEEVQLCIMGSHGPENEYVSCASVSLGASA